MRRVQLSLILGTLLLLYPAPSMAVPFQITFSAQVTSGGTPGVANPDVLTVRVIADNGGATSASQSWFQADVISATASAGTYSATFNFPFFINNPLFTTNAASTVVNAGFFDLDGNNTDNLGSGSPQLFANLMLTSIGTVLNFTSVGPADPAAWTVSAATAVPEPATLLLLGSGMAAAALRRRVRR